MRLVHEIPSLCFHEVQLRGRFMEDFGNLSLGFYFTPLLSICLQECLLKVHRSFNLQNLNQLHYLKLPTKG